jgi:SAM-dependent methyltransferase
MKVFESPLKNALYLGYRLVSPVFDPMHFVRGLTGYIWYLRDLVHYQSKSSGVSLFGSSMYPMLHDKTSHPFDAHYFYQQLWVFENVLKTKPKLHTDISSTYEMSGYLSKIVKTKFVDYRPFDAKLKNLEVEQGDILNLKFADNSVKSLSCLHVIEHIGLGRYGDPIDPAGTEKACRELARVLAKNGRLYLSTPIGQEKICFNAHRISDPLTVLSYMPELKLELFSVVDDEGNFHQNVSPKKYRDLHYGCGMFLLRK